MARAALVVASSNYDDESLQQLRGPSADAEALAAVLADETIGGFEVDLLTDRPSHEVSRHIARFYADRTRDDLLLLYFSGHGLKDDAGRLYFAMTDTDRTLPEATAVSASFVNDVMQRSRARTQVLLLDCCFSGAFARGFAAKGDKAVQTAERFVAPSGTGRVVLTASDAIQYAFEGDTAVGAGTGSVFTRHLVEGLRSGKADIDEDGEIAVTELYDYLYERVSAELPSQRPEKWEWGMQGRLVIARNPSLPAATLPFEIQHTLGSSLPTVRIVAVDELAALAAGPHRRTADAAREALTNLLDDDSLRVRDAARDALARLGPQAPVSPPPPPPPPPPPTAPTTSPPAPSSPPPAAVSPSPVFAAPGPPPSQPPKRFPVALLVVILVAVAGVIVGAILLSGGDDGGGGSDDSTTTVVSDGSAVRIDMGVVDTSAAVTGELAGPDDVHVYTFVGTGDVTIDLVDTVNGEDTNLDPYLRLVDAAGAEVGSDDDGGDQPLDSQLSISTTPGETYTIEVSSYSDDVGGYTLSVTPASGP